MKRILCPYCGHNIWKYKTEKKIIPLGDRVITRTTEYKICSKCQKKLK